MNKESKKGYYCYGKKDFCHKGNSDRVVCGDCEYFNDEGGELLLINENKSNNFDVKSNEELFKQALVEGVNRRFDREIEEAKKIEQIEEMAKILCKNGCKDCIQTLCADWYKAEALYNAGYRKQSEGEWLDIDICAEDMYCSVCGGIAPVDCEKEAFFKSNYCPNCGAKMKGGE